MDLVWDDNEAQLVCAVTQENKVAGYVVIDSTVAGHASGGLRLLPDIDEADMRALAHSMTLKYGFLGLPQGGAKAGVIGDPEAPLEERRARLGAFAQAIAPLLRGRIYLPGADMGTDGADIRHMMETVGVSTRRREWRTNRAGYYTALTVFVSAREAAQHLGLDLSDCIVAIEGFGKVGGSLAALMDGAGARVVAISTARGAIHNCSGLDVARLRVLAAEAGSRVVDLYGDADRIDPTDLLELPVDLLCPCARQNAVHLGNAPRVAARIVSPGANNPITPDAEQLLSRRGVLCLPDFVTNSGGVLGGRMEFASIRHEQITRFVQHHFGGRMEWMLAEAARRGVTPREIAVPIALSRFDRVRRRASRPALRERLLHLGLESYRRGWIPGPLVASVSMPFFERAFA